MELTVYPPIPPLGPYIKAIIHFESKVPVPLSNFYPLGDQFLLATLEGQIEFTNALTGTFLLPALSMNGQSTVHMKARLSFPSRVLAVQFRPHGCYALFGHPMNALLNYFLDAVLPSHLGSHLLSQLRQAVGPTELVGKMNEHLLLRLSGRPHYVPDFIHRALHLIEEHKGKIDITSILSEIHTTQRTLERNFLRIVGVQPKTFSRICRFNHLMTELVEDSSIDFYQAIESYGYFDPSHFIKDFIRFTGCNPAAFKEHTAHFELNRQHILQLYGHY